MNLQLMGEICTISCFRFLVPGPLCISFIFVSVVHNPFQCFRTGFPPFHDTQSKRQRGQTCVNYPPFSPKAKHDTQFQEISEADAAKLSFSCVTKNNCEIVVVICGEKEV